MFFYPVTSIIFVAIEQIKCHLRSRGWRSLFAGVTHSFSWFKLNTDGTVSSHPGLPEAVISLEIIRGIRSLILVEGLVRTHCYLLCWGQLKDDLLLVQSLGIMKIEEEIRLFGSCGTNLATLY